jgi:hypothetical protein
VGVFYWPVVAVTGLLAYEHSLVRPGDLRRLDTAFFTMNRVISVTFFVCAGRCARMIRAAGRRALRPQARASRLD